MGEQGLSGQEGGEEGGGGRQQDHAPAPVCEKDQQNEGD